MSFIQGVYVDNPHGVLYLKGDTNINGSQRIIVDEKDGLLIVEERIEEEWIMAPFKHIQNFDSIVTTEDGSCVIDESGNFITVD